MDESSSPQAITALLHAWSEGDLAARDKLLPIVYADLRRRAAAYLRRERKGHTLQPTALVHEAFLRLAQGSEVQWQNRGQFFGVASRIMRRILVDHARGRRSAKRRGDRVQITLVEDAAVSQPRAVDLIALDEALDELAAFDTEQARLVELRYFAGLSIEETAEVLGTSPATVKREWALARAWLYRRLTGAAGPGTSGSAPVEG